MTQDNATPSKVVPLKPPTASELRSRLLGALPSILHYLLPAGVLRGGKFMVGNVQGDIFACSIPISRAVLLCKIRQ